MKDSTSTGHDRWRTQVSLVVPQVRYEHLIAGVSGGVTSTLVLHPLDLLKIRLAVNDGQLKSRPQYRGILNAVSTIIKEEGLRGLYRGVAPNCWGAGTSWGLYFLFYNSIKSWMLEGSPNQQLGPGKHMMAAAESGLLTLVITNPITMVKTRMCLQYADHHMDVPATRRYTGMLDAFQKVYKYEGVTGLYRVSCSPLSAWGNCTFGKAFIGSIALYFVAQGHVPNCHCSSHKWKGHCEDLSSMLGMNSGAAVGLSSRPVSTRLLILLIVLLL